MIRFYAVPTIVILALCVCVSAQQRGTAKADPVERLGENLFKVGNIRVDTAKHELSVAGKVNDATALEFVACTKGGMKAYESAIELDTDAIMFNIAMILVGFDRSKGVAPKMHFDSNQPQGDTVEIIIEWDASDGHHKVHAEELLWNTKENVGLSPGQWVYTGSVILEDGRFLAEMDGVIIGFVHTPAPIIERTTFEQKPYGMVRLNPSLGLSPGNSVTMTFRNPKSAKR